MILNWDDGNNIIFKFKSDLTSASDFKASKRGKWISQIPKFHNNVSVGVEENLSPTLLKYSPLGILLEVLLRSFDAADFGCLTVQWIRSYEESTHLFRSKC